jgi:hypothetical protein
MIKRLCLFSFLLLFFHPILQGQSFTVVTGTLLDSQSQLWSGAIVNARIVPSFGNPAGLLNVGHAITDSPQSTTTDVNGIFTLTLDDNAKVTPAGSKWHFDFCPNATVVICSQLEITITGTSMNISSQITSALSPIAKVPALPNINRAYGDSEVVGGTGSIYWRTSDNTLRGCSVITNGLCSAWGSIGGSGIGVSAFTYANCTTCTNPTVVNKLAVFTSVGGTGFVENVSNLTGLSTSLVPYQQAFLVVGGAGASGNASLSLPGNTAQCVMDTTNNGGNLNGTYVGVSSSILGDCSLLGTQYPVAGVWIVGLLLDTSTTQGANANILVLNTVSTGAKNDQVIYDAPGIYGINLGTNGNKDAIQNFPCDSHFCTLVIGGFTTFPCCSLADGSIGLGPPSGTNAVSHLEYSVNGLPEIAMTTDDDPCDFSSNCTGTGKLVKQSQGVLFSPTFWNPVTNNITVNAQDGNFADIGPGTGLLMTGAVNSGQFSGPVNNNLGETIVQATTGATSTFVLIEPNGSMLMTAVSGSPDNNHIWTGQQTLATYLPTSVPGVPFCQYSPTALHDYFCYGNYAQISNNGDALSKVLRGSDYPSGPNSDYVTTATAISGATVVVTTPIIGKGQIKNFECHGIYKITAAAHKLVLSITASQTPQLLNFWGSIVTDTVAGAVNYPTPGSSSGTLLTSSAIVVTLGALYPFEIHGVIKQNASNTGTISLNALTDNAASTVTILANTAYCRIN